MDKCHHRPALTRLIGARSRYPEQRTEIAFLSPANHVPSAMTRGLSIWAVSMVRDEEDVIVQTVRHLLAQGVDHVLADNLSRDRTRERLDAFASGRLVTVIDDLDPAYR